MNLAIENHIKNYPTSFSANAAKGKNNIRSAGRWWTVDP